MKTFEIGIGRMVIKAPDYYYCEQENEETVMLSRQEEDDEPEIRFTVIGVVPVEQFSAEDMLARFRDEATEKNTEVRQVQDKVYFSYKKEYDGDIIYYYQISYLHSIISMSACVYKECTDETVHSTILKDAEQMLESIDLLENSKFVVIEPKDTDIDYVVDSVCQLLKVEEEEVGDYYESGKALDRLQALLDDKLFRLDDLVYLEKLGLLFGSLIRYYYQEFSWAVISDEYGRELVLRFRGHEAVSFPISMIRKRLEEGEHINVAELMTDHYDSVLANIGQ
ncbi:MAG: DUF3806 domain-containing protein [Myroides sp.]|jgi:hypothetical protein|nr:DUF3806 domain-containing protein [Myroides sp.]